MMRAVLVGFVAASFTYFAGMASLFAHFQV